MGREGGRGGGVAAKREARALTDAVRSREGGSGMSTWESA